MKMPSRTGPRQAGLAGMLAILSPLPFLLPCLERETALVSADLCLVLAACAAGCCLACAWSIERRPLWGRLFGAGAVCTAFFISFSTIRTDPFAALAGTVTLLAMAALLLERSPQTDRASRDTGRLRLQRARWAASTLSLLAVCIVILDLPPAAPKLSVLVVSALIGQLLFLHWAVGQRLWWHAILGVVGLVGMAMLAALQLILALAGAVLLFNLAVLLMVPSDDRLADGEGQWWFFLMRHPARILLTTFLLLCLAGSLLLALPAATVHSGIAPVDASFTAVSAACVTGLTVLDTARDFTPLGQGLILLLIQLGGLGIMSITTLALSVWGHRLSLQHERMLVAMTESSHRDLLRSLALILKCTVFFEGVGAVLLTLFFFLGGESLPSSLWQGVFTAVSAFCNAGFSLQSDNLVAFQHAPFVLHTVALLIILGGLAPATSVLIPAWLSGKMVPVTTRIALVSTVVLLFTGAFFILIFEWHGAFDGLSVQDKLHNAWLQSATLRTAGFNSVDLSGIAAPTFLVMNVLMFIGGCPGGTAGGIKATTIAVLALTFWTTIVGRRDVIVQKRRIHPETVYRAITVTMAGALVWFVLVLMLTTTQQIDTSALIFEATSALGTVGLTIGATPLLDEIGKVIVIIAMFIGRIGPLTLFMLLSDQQQTADSRYPAERITIT